MPELPEVETIVRDLGKSNLVGQQIVKTTVLWKRSIATPKASQFTQQLTGQTIRAVSRRAKFIVLELQSGSSVLIHLRMTGQLNFFKASATRNKHDHVVLLLQDGRELRFNDTRKFGRWYLFKNAREKFDSLGPEPLERDFTETFLRSGLAKHKRQLKPLLLDQSFVAGLGNIYVDEALFEAKLHPERVSNSLKPSDAKVLHKAIVNVLRRGIKNLGTSLGAAETNFYSVGKRRGRNQDSLRVFRRTGKACPRCGALIERIIVSQRSSHVCLKCQH